jgi:hypothetical protein
VRYLYNHFLKINIDEYQLTKKNAAVNIHHWGHQPWTIDHAGQELPPAPVDVITDILTHWGLLSANTIKQEATAL